MEKQCEKELRAFPSRYVIEELVFDEFEHVIIGYFEDRYGVNTLFIICLFNNI
jgi:hypothetical protein